MAAVQLKQVRHNHDAIIDFVIANPGVSQGEIARAFDRTQSWISVVFNSEAFRARLEERREEIVDPWLLSTFEDKMRGVLATSLEVLQEKLEQQRNPNVAVRVLEHGSRALGYGARAAVAPVQVQTYVAVVPAKALGAAEWVHEHAPVAAAKPVALAEEVGRQAIEDGGKKEDPAPEMKGSDPGLVVIDVEVGGDG